jgi:hypothetical protein
LTVSQPPEVVRTRRRAWRWLGRGAFALGALALLLASIVWLAGREALDLPAAHRWANRRPDRVQVDWKTARMTAWERVEIEGFRLSGQTRAVQWRVEADHLTAHVTLPGLLARRIDTRDVEARGVTVRVVRTARPAGALLFGGATPKLEEFDQHPYVVRPPPPPRPAAKLVPHWHFDFPDMQITELRDVWIEDLRYQGMAAAEGGFQLTLGGDFELFESTLRLPDEVIEGDSVMTLGDEATLSEFRGSAQIRVAPYRPRDLRGWDVLSQVTATTDLRARGEGIDLLRASVAAGAPWLGLSGRRGVPLDADVTFERGTWRAPSTIRGGTSEIEATALDYTARGLGEWQWADAAGPGAAGPHARLDVKLTGVAIQRGAAQKPHVTGGNLALVATTESLDTKGAFVTLAPQALDLTGATVPDVRVYNSYLPSATKFRLLSGSASSQAHLEPLPGKPDTLRGSVTLIGKRIGALAEDTRLTGNFHLDATFPAIDWKGLDISLAGTRLALDSVRAAGGDSARGAFQTGSPWSGAAKVSRGRVRPGKTPFLDARAQVDLSDSRPLVFALEQKRPLPGFVSRALTVEGVEARGSLSLSSGEMRLSDFVAEGGADKLEFKADFVRRGEAPLDGIFFGRYRALKLGIALHDGERDLKFLGAEEWYEKQPKP